MMDTMDVVTSTFYDMNDNDLKELWNSDGFDESVSDLLRAVRAVGDFIH